jgi:hypothetical protein
MSVPPAAQEQPPQTARKSRLSELREARERLRSAVLSRLESARAFYRRMKHSHFWKVVKITREKARAFRILSRFLLGPDGLFCWDDAAEQQQVTRAVRHAAIVTAYRENRGESLAGAAGLVLASVYPLIAIVVMFALILQMLDAFRALRWLFGFQKGLALLGGYLTVLGVQVVINDVKRRASFWPAVIGVLLLVGAGGLHFLAVSSVGWHHALADILRPSWQVLLAFWLALTAVFLVVPRVLRLYEKACYRLYPEAFIQTELFRLLARLWVNPDRWPDFGFRRDLLQRLENVAYCVQHGVPARLGGGDAATGAWLAGRAAQMAERYRSLKRWVLTPLPGTRENLIARLGASLDHIARGEWGQEWEDLQALPMEAVSVRRRWRERLSELLRKVCLAGLPVVGLLLFRWQYPKTVLPAYVTGGVLLYAVVTLLTLDPDFSAKTPVMKDLFPWLPLPGKEKK